jgi:cyanate permease
MKQGRFSFNGRADDPQSSPFLLGMLFDWTGGFMAGGYFVVAMGLGILLMSFLFEKKAVEEFRSF